MDEFDQLTALGYPLFIGSEFEHQGSLSALPT